MKKQLLIAAAGATFLITYFLLRKKYFNTGDPEFKSNRNLHSHHLTQAFANAKKHAMS